MVPARSPDSGPLRGDERGLSPVVGVALMVAITVLLAAVVAALLLGAADLGVAPTTDTAVNLDQTAAGTELTPEFGGSQAVDVRLDGETLTTIDGDDTGRTIFLPTAPGDEVILVASDGEGDVLLRETFEADEAGDFVAYYPFDEGDSQLNDRSGHNNHGDFDEGASAPDWNSDATGTYRDFDGTQSVDVPDLSTGDTDVEAFTVAVTFRHTADGGDRQQLVEHNEGGEEWHLETNGDDGVQFSVDYDGTSGSVVDSADGALDDGEVHVVVGTYDGEHYRLYVDGTEVDADTRDATADMGRMRIGNDDSGNTQFFRGRMYEFRLYHTDLDAHQVEMLTRVLA